MARISAKKLVDRQLGRDRKPILMQDAFIIPNHSGEHTAGWTDTPIEDRDIANKIYVDDNTYWVRSGDTMKTKNNGDVVEIGDVTNSNYAKFEDDGTLEFFGEATAYDDQQVNMGDVATNGWFGDDYCEIVEYRSGVALEFTNSTVSKFKIRFNAQLSHKYHEGEDIEFHIHVGGDSATSGTAVFQLTYQWASIEGTFPSSTVATKKTVTIDGTNGKHQYDDIVANISGSDKQISSILLCELERLAGDTNDTFAESVFVVGLDFHIPVNTVGSRTAVVK